MVLTWSFVVPAILPIIKGGTSACTWGKKNYVIFSLIPTMY